MVTINERLLLFIGGPADGKLLFVRDDMAFVNYDILIPNLSCTMFNSPCFSRTFDTFRYIRSRYSFSKYHKGEFMLLESIPIEIANIMLEEHIKSR